MMRAIGRRISRLEDQFCTASGNRRDKLWVVCKYDWGLALDKDTCIDILEESGFLLDSQFGGVDLMKVPDGLNAKELERYLREHRSELSSTNRTSHQNKLDRRM
jgi:hypothetical protein